MSPNSHIKKNCPEKWCAFKMIVWLGIVNCLLIHMPEQSTQNSFLLMELSQKGLKSVNVKMMMFIFIVELRFLVMAIIVAYKAQSTFFSRSIELNTQLAPFIEFYTFYSCDLSPLNHLLNCNSLEATQVKMLISEFYFSSI